MPCSAARRLSPAHSLALCAVLFSSALAASGCGTRVIKEEIYDRDAVAVVLQHTRKGPSLVERNFAHPASVAKQRLVHVLGALVIETVEDKKKVQRPAFAPELLDPLAKALVTGFEEANSDQEIAVSIVRKQRRLGVFHKKFLTTFVAYMRDERLYVHLSRIEWEIPKSFREGRALPAPVVGEKQMAFRMVPGRKMTQAGSQGAAIRWRDPYFSVPVRVVAEGESGGTPRTRTILMESPIPKDELEADAPALDGVDPDTLRALADLEEARRGGNLTETEYQRRRETLLGGDRF